MTFSIVAAAGLTAASAVFLWRNAGRDTTKPPKDDDWSEW